MRFSSPLRPCEPGRSLLAVPAGPGPRVKAWTPPFTAMVRDWWVSARRVEGRHFGRTLVPNTLMARFDTFALMRATPVVGCPTARVEVPVQVNQWAGEFGTFSTTRQVMEDTPPAYSPPALLPLKVTRRRAPGPRIEPFRASDGALGFGAPHPPPPPAPRRHPRACQGTAPGPETGARLRAPLSRARGRGGTGSRDIRDFFLRPTSHSDPTPDLSPNPNPNPNRYPTPDIDPSPDTTLAPNRNPNSNPDLGLDPAPRMGWTVREFFTRTPPSSDPSPDLAPNLGSVSNLAPSPSYNPIPIPNPKPNPRSKRPRSPPERGPARPPPPNRIRPTCELCLHRAAGNLSESSTMRHTCLSPGAAPLPSSHAPPRKRPRSPSATCPTPYTAKRGPATRPAGIG